MAIRRRQHSIRFSNDEWNAIAEAANRNDMTPGEFVREAASRAAAGRLDVKEARMTPELIELLKRTFRGVHILTYLKRREISDHDGVDAFRRDAEICSGRSDPNYRGRTQQPLNSPTTAASPDGSTRDIGPTLHTLIRSSISSMISILISPSQTVCISSRSGPGI